MTIDNINEDQRVVKLIWKRYCLDYVSDVVKNIKVGISVQIEWVS